MDNPQNQNWKFGFGLLAGAVLGYWLNSDKGRRVRKEVQTNAVVYGEQAATYVKDQASSIGETATNYYEQGKETAANYYEQGKEMVDNAATTVKKTLVTQVDEVADDAEAVVETAETKVKSGINRARRNIKNSAEKIA